jgi:hypothetical protein
VLEGIGDHHFSGMAQKTQETSPTISEAAEDRKNESSLYFVECRRRVIEPVAPGVPGRFATREVTLIYLSFTNNDISIALPGGGVTLEGGTNGT